MAKILVHYDDLPLPNRKIYDLVQERTGGSVKAFAEMIGVSQQVLDRIFKPDPRSGKFPSVSDKIKDGIKNVFGVNETWFVSEKVQDISEEEKIDMLKDILRNSYGIDPDAVDKRSDEPSSENLTYLLPMSAMGGPLTGFASQGIALQDCEKVISPIKGVDFAITIYGESMAPEYPSGSRILIKKINPNIFIDWGKAYVLDTPNGVIVKEIHECKDKPGYIKCHSINPDPKFSDFEVPLSEIYGMYRVLMCLSAK